MNTIKQESFAELTEKKSKFICELCYVETAKEVEEKIDEIKRNYKDAKHHCFAYRILEENNIVERASDDGEPSGTAGAPMLNLLKKNELVNVLAVVTRYFGGILLGTGGLVRAYSSVTSNAIQKAEIALLKEGEILKIPVSYQNLAYLQYYCRKNDITILKTNFDGEQYIIIEVIINEKDKIIHEMQEKQFNIRNIEVVKKTYLQKSV